MWRAYRIVCLSAAAAFAPAIATADEPPLTASLQCDRAPEPGRVRCTVETRAQPGRALQWADVVLVELPDFTQALKGRLGPADRLAQDATTERWAFGLVARKRGEGTAKVRVRAVVCTGDRCTTVTVEASAPIRVG